MRENKIFYGWFVVVGCILITCTMVPPVMSLSNKYLLQVTSDMEISRSAFSMVNTILLGLGIFISPIVSKKLAKGNMKRIQVVSILGYVIAYASYSVAQNVYHMYISAIFLGIFYLNSTLIPVSMLITNWFIKKRGIAMSLAMAGIGIGGFVFSPVITYLLETVGWRSTYQIMAVVILVIALPTALFLLEKSPEAMGLKPYGYEENDDAQSTSKPKASTLNMTVSESKGHIFFWILMLGMLANGIINSGALGQFPPAIEEMCGPAVQATVISIYSMVGVLGKIFLGWVNDKYGVFACEIIGCTTFGAAFIFMLFADSAYSLYIMAVIFGIGLAIGTVLPPLLTAAVFGTDKYGEAYGIANSFSQIGLSTGSLIVAAMFDQSGSYNTAWILLFSLTMLTMVTWGFSVLKAKKYHTTH